ncbi:hypothetical protein D3C78_1297040 [compost metagenome]
MQGLVDFAFADAQAVAGGVLQLQLLVDHQVQHLPRQHAGRRQCHVLPFQAGGDFGFALLQFAQRDHAVVDHGDDAVGGLHGSAGRGGQAEGEGRGKKELFHQLPVVSLIGL